MGKKTKTIKKMGWKDKVNALADLQASAGWEVLLANLSNNLHITEKVILEKQSIDGETITDAEVDLLRERRQVLIGLIDSPSVLSAMLTEDNHEPEGVNYDPYPTPEDESDEESP